jgi:hypothetical protein
MPLEFRGLRQRKDDDDREARVGRRNARDSKLVPTGAKDEHLAATFLGGVRY